MNNVIASAAGGAFLGGYFGGMNGAAIGAGLCVLIYMIGIAIKVSRKL